MLDQIGNGPVENIPKTELKEEIIPKIIFIEIESHTLPLCTNSAIKYSDMTDFPPQNLA